MNILTAAAAQIEEKLWAHRRHSNAADAQKPISLHPETMGDPESVLLSPKVSPLLRPRQPSPIPENLSAMRLAPDEESEVVVENHAAMTGCEP